VTDSTTLSAAGICVARDGRDILQQVDFALNPAEVVGLLGPNGAGKSTLLSVLAGVSAQDSGTVKLGSADLNGMAHSERARQVAYLPQNAPVHWPLTVSRVVALGRLPHRDVPGNSRQADAAQVEAALRQTEMAEFRHRTMESLSGGERMRVLVARMLAVQARVLLADEPVTGLDPYFQLEFMDLFLQQARQGRSVVLVLHDLTLAARYCDRVVVLDEGRVAAAGKPEEVLDESLLASVYRVEGLRADASEHALILPWKRLS